MSDGKGKSETKSKLNLIVRVVGVDLDGGKPIYRALTRIKGVGIRMAKNIAIIFEKQTGVSFSEKLGVLSEEQVKLLEQIILNPVKAGVPKWCVNRQKDLESGEYLHLTTSNLDLGIRSDIQRLTQIKSYRGLRHAWGLPVRGQRTRSTHRGKGGVIGVMKKDSGQQKSAAKSSAQQKQQAKQASKKK